MLNPVIQSARNITPVLLLLLGACEKKPETPAGAASNATTMPAVVAQPTASVPSSVPVASGTTLIVAGPKNLAMLPIVADRRGFFAGERLKAGFRSLQTGKLAMDAVTSGDIDVGVLVDTNVAHALFQGDVDLRVIASVMEKTDDALVFRADRGILNPSDLIGRTIAYVPATTSDSFLWRFLAAHDIAESSVKLLPTTPPALQTAAMRGDVDAAAIWEPWRFNIQKELADKGGTFPNTGVYTAHAVLAVRRRTLEQRRSELEQLLRALVAAEEYVRANPEAAQELLAVEIPIDPDALTRAWVHYQPRVRWAAELLQNLRTEGTHLRATKPEFRDKPLPDYARVLDPSVLQAVAPERIRLTP